MGALSQALDKIGPSTSGSRCSLGTLRKTLSKPDQAEFDAAFKSGRTWTDLAKAIAMAYSLKVSASTVARHGRRDCACQEN